MLDQKDTEGSQGHSQATVKPEVRFKESVGIGETQIAGASLLAQLVKNLPALQETRVRACKDPLEKEMATHSSVVAREIPWTEEPGGLLFRVLEQEKQQPPQIDGWKH